MDQVEPDTQAKIVEEVYKRFFFDWGYGIGAVWCGLPCVSFVNGAAWCGLEAPPLKLLILSRDPFSWEGGHD